MHKSFLIVLPILMELTNVRLVVVEITLLHDVILKETADLVCISGTKWIVLNGQEDIVNDQGT